MNIAVIGAGVIGTSVGVRLLETFPQANVTIFAEKLSPDTTSDVAAGLWLPYALGTNVERNEKWCKSTFKFLSTIITTNPQHHKYGMFFQELYDLSNDEALKICFVHNIFSNSRLMNANELEKFGSFKYGIASTTIMSQGTKLMAFLTERFLSKGGKIMQIIVKNFDEIQMRGNYPIIINCTGLGARQLCNDTEIYPLRGQIVKVEAPWVKFAIIFGGGYILPQSDGTVVLGGTRQKDNYDLTPNEIDTNQIMNKCCKVLPGLKECKVVAIKVGLRPFRSSVRLECEQKVNKTSGVNYTLIHNYGHGGSGLTLFWGCAGNVVELVKKEVVQAKI